jgi:uncharacterized protein
VALIQYNYLDTAMQAGTEGLRYAHRKGIGVAIMEPLKGGFLARPPSAAMELIRKAAVSRTPVDWALQFLWDRPEIGVVLSGMNSRAMVDENCACAERSGADTLAETENALLDELAAILRRSVAVPCTACGYCMPCPSGVNIPQNFALLNNRCAPRGTDFGNKAIQWMVTRSYGSLAGNARQLGKKPDNGKASLCTKCNACVAKCPQQIAIPRELEKVVATFGR